MYENKSDEQSHFWNKKIDASFLANSKALSVQSTRIEVEN